MIVQTIKNMENMSGYTGYVGKKEYRDMVVILELLKEEIKVSPTSNMLTIQNHNII